MATIHDKLTEWCEASGVKPHTVYQVQSVFMAGAAAMAELFASGQGLKVTNANNDHRCKHIMSFGDIGVKGQRCQKYRGHDDDHTYHNGALSWATETNKGT
jgi:hypothetical protein